MVPAVCVDVGHPPRGASTSRRQFWRRRKLPEVSALKRIQARRGFGKVISFRKLGLNSSQGYLDLRDSTKNNSRPDTNEYWEEGYAIITEEACCQPVAHARLKYSLHIYIYIYIYATTDGPPLEIQSLSARITRFGRDRVVDEDGNVGTVTSLHLGVDKFRSLDELRSALSLP